MFLLPFRYTFTEDVLVLIPLLDFRRHVRPFFLSPDGQHPTSYKIYYDILSYLATQTAFCFTTAPFVLLTLPSSLLVWARVYFYAVLGTAASMAFFASPAKPWLVKRLKQRNQNATQPKEVKEHPLLGMPSDLAGDIDEAIQEISNEVDARKRRGQSISMPTGGDLKAVVEDKLGRKI